MSGLSILGGGPAGLGVAFYAARAGLPFTLYEKAQALGGMCRTFKTGPHRWDAGAHRFHDRDADVTADVRALLGSRLRRVDAPNRVWTRGRYVDFPPSPLNAALSYGPAGALRVAWEAARAPRSGPPPEHFEEYATRRFGPTLARDLLLNYSEKLWGLPARRLSCDVATRRLQGLTLRALAAEMLFGRRKAAHLDGRFYYPDGGYGAIAEALAAGLPRDSVEFGREAVGLDVEGGRLVRVRWRDGEPLDVEGRVVSTLPLPALARLLGEHSGPFALEAAARLRFRRLRLVFLRLAQPRVSENASIYLPEARYCVSRVHEPKNRSAAMAPADETSLVAEVPCFPGDAIDELTAPALARRVVDELDAIGLISGGRVLEWRHELLPFAYPVYSRGYEADVAAVRRGVSGISNLDTVGRAGAFHYSHLHDQLRFAKDYVAALDVKGPLERREPTAP
ncbi:MAG: FAD-dependent oxidoreductase [Elusimicrobia bacterium]|nr:FAD-dependent oxidoreductase [Elusimicrobiota bacterium]